MSNGPGLGGATTGIATVWELGSTVVRDELGTLNEGDHSAAYGINNDNDPVIVGRSETVKECDEVPGSVVAPFRLRYDSTPMEIIPTGVSGTIQWDSAAFDVDNTSGTWPDVVGTQEARDECDTPSIGTCVLLRDPVKWTGTSSVSLLDEIDEDREHHARGVNEDGEIVGFGTDESDPCVQEALAWSVPGTSGYVNLASYNPTSGDSRAEAVTEPDGSDSLFVVGTNTDAAIGMLWKGAWSGSSYSWSGTELDTSELCSCTSQWDILAAHDINDSGVIIALADSGGVTFHAVLLIPVEDCSQVECEGDVNESGTVDGTDLALLLGAWGICGSSGCPADFDCNGVINGSDLAILLGNWGSCSSFAPGGHPSLEELMEILTEDGHSDLADLLQSIWES